jgi:DNA-binding SARP family transcriptional activator
VAGAGRYRADGETAPALSVRLLGPVQLYRGGVEADLGAAGPRTLFSVLTARVGTVVSMEELIAALWGDRPPKSADGAVYTYVSMLRKTLAPEEPRPAKTGVLTSSRAGYCLRLPVECVDLRRFEEAAAQARAARGEQDGPATLEHADAALAEWAGPALGGATGPFVEAERSRLELARLDVRELRCTALLETGSSIAAAAELALLAERNPLRERLHELLMLALYRTGRQAEALQVYQAVRERLVDELGIEPGPALRQMHRLVLDATEAQESLALLTPELITVGGPSASNAGAGAGTEPARRRHDLVIPAQLPHCGAELIGRDEELLRLEQLCAIPEPGGSGRSAVISAIDGVGGVGKTALAIHAAQRLVGSFPDGQLYVDLRGFDPRLPPVTPGDALERLLRGLGADVEALHDGDIDAQAALYRSMLAGRRVLVVLDNAVSAEQVRPLLPGSSGCLALVTSRDRLAGFAAREGAVRISLDVLSPAASVEVLRRSLGAQAVERNLDEARELAALCGNLPLALRIAAERIASSEHYDLADLVSQLRGERDRLDALALADDEYAAVRAVFSWSYHALKPETAQTFRLLGLHPNGEFGIEAASALLGCTPEFAERRLHGLLVRHLVEQVERGRYRFFDLIRIYAAECAERDERPEVARAAVERLLRWSIGSAAAVHRVLVPALIVVIPAETETVGPLPVLRSYDDALGWACRELSGLSDLVDLAVSRGFDELAARLVCVCGSLFFSTSRWTEWLRVIGPGVQAARRAGNDLAVASLHKDRGLAYHFLGRQDEAVACHLAAVDILTRLEHPCRRAVTVNLAVAYSMMGRHLREFPLLEKALELAREQDDLFVEAVVADNFGATLSRVGRHAEAVDWGRRSLELIRRIGAEHMLGHTLIRVGESCRRAGRPGEAVEHLEEALALWRARGNLWGQTRSLRALAKARLAAGEPERARGLLGEALALLGEGGRAASGQDGAEEIRALLARLPEPAARPERPELTNVRAGAGH